VSRVDDDALSNPLFQFAVLGALKMLTWEGA